jgi:DNA-binding LytR/AlgR family response regulator
MLTCYVIDDEKGAVDLLVNFIEKTPFLKLAGTTTNPLEAIKVLKDQKVDLVFLDIQMPNITGLELMSIFQGKFNVILTSAYSNYALEGFENNALDYLLKPFSFDRFLKAAQKALTATAFSAPQWQPEEQEDDYIFVKTENKGKMIKVNFKDILYVEGLKNYVSIYTKEDRIVTLLNIKDLEERLPQKRFLRVHKSYIVSVDSIKALDGNQILLTDIKAYIPLGETYRPAFFNSLQKNVMGGKK